jgi:hypothetical protein
MTDQINISHVDSARNIDSLVEALPETVRQMLADLEHAPRQSAETTIGLLPFGRRALLEAVKVTRTTTIDEGDGKPTRQQVSITDWGRQVIAACAAYEKPDLDELEQEQRARELRAQLSPTPPVSP